MITIIQYLDNNFSIVKTLSEDGKVLSVIFFSSDKTKIGNFIKTVSVKYEDFLFNRLTGRSCYITSMVSSFELPFPE